MGNPNRSSDSAHSLATRDASSERAQGVSGSKADPFTLDLQTLLTHSVVRLRDVTGMAMTVAWALRPDGAPYVAAASFEGDPPVAPTSADFVEVSTLHTVSTLDASDAHVEIAKRHRLSAAVVVRGAERTALAVLGLGPQTARPRVLAALDTAARRLEVPLAAAMAAGRFRQLDREVRRIDRLAALGTLTAEIAHEVRNPLVSVKTFLQLLPERGSDPEFAENFLELVNDELRRMERLLDGIIQHAQPSGPSASRGPGKGAGSPGESAGSPGESAGASLDAAMAAALALLTHRSDKSGVHLDCEDLAALPLLEIGTDNLRQVVLNLLLNAIEVTPPRSGVRVTGAADANFVTFRIEDEGPGIPPELREEIFTAFYSTRSQRSGGLGLAITRRIVAEAGGTIVAGDGERGGAEFCVRLPVAGESDAARRSTD